jgi:hypothetical protein
LGRRSDTLPGMNGLVSDKLGGVEQACRRFRVKRLFLFGSAAQGRFDPGTSDLDFLVALDEASPADYTENYFGLAHELERLFGRPVDLVTERSVRNPHFRRMLETTRQLVYEG